MFVILDRITQKLIIKILRKRKTYSTIGNEKIKTIGPSNENKELFRSYRSKFEVIWISFITKLLNKN